MHHRTRVLELHLAVGQQVLHRLEGADRLAELLALARVVGREVDQPVGDAELLRGAGEGARGRGRRPGERGRASPEATRVASEGVHVTV